MAYAIKQAECQACRKKIHPEATKCPFCQTEQPECVACRKRIHPKATKCPHCKSDQVATAEFPAGARML